jgi:ubiquinone/menaquinone biosynthesis C-methylase UbiE
MDARLQRRVQRYGWDRAVPFYEESWSAQLAPAQELLLELADLRPGEHVLDVACGTGLVTIPAARSVGPEGRVLATDISDGMVAAARSMCADAGVTGVEFARMGAENLDVESGAFDAALCALGLMYVPEPDAALRQIRDALRPGGRMVLAVWGARQNCGWAGIFPVVDSRVNTDVCPMFFHLGTSTILAEIAEQEGFRDVSLHRIGTVLEYDTDDDAVSAAFAGGPVAMAYARFDADLQAEARLDYLSSIAGFKNGSGYRIPGEFVVVRGFRGEG